MIADLLTPTVGLPILIALVLVAILAPLTYNIFFHPLRKFPGPAFARATRIPATYHEFDGTMHYWIKDLHDQYGPVVRYRPDALAWSDPVAWKDIYGHKIQNRGDMPKHGVSTAVLGGKHSILSMNNSDHTRARRLLSHAMSDKAIKEQQTIIEQYVEALVDKIRDAAVMANRAQVDLVALYNYTAFDVMADLSFGEPLGMLAKGEWTPWLKSINEGSEAAIKVKSLGHVFPPFLVNILLLFIPKEQRQAITTHVEYSKSQVEKRLATDTQRPDFWTYLLRNQGKEEGSLSREETHSMGTTLMFAGSETTATAASGLTRLLLDNPSKFERLNAEIRAAFPSTNDMDMDKLAALPYLHCCIRESMRLYPPVPRGRSRFCPPGGRQVGGYFVPEGTIVDIIHHAAYRSEANWHRPLEFIPERWLPENATSGEFANDHRDVLQPFSFGPRNCIGKNLAYHELRMIIASVFWHFDFELAVEGEDWFDHPAYIVHQKPPLMVIPKLAKHVQSQA